MSMKRAPVFRQAGRGGYLEFDASSAKCACRQVLGVIEARIAKTIHLRDLGRVY
jgi:hypothetical protein